MMPSPPFYLATLEGTTFPGFPARAREVSSRTELLHRLPISSLSLSLSLNNLAKQNDRQLQFPMLISKAQQMDCKISGWQKNGLVAQ